MKMLKIGMNGDRESGRKPANPGLCFFCLACVVGTQKVSLSEGLHSVNAFQLCSPHDQRLGLEASQGRTVKSVLILVGGVYRVRPCIARVSDQLLYNLMLAKCSSNKC